MKLAFINLYQTANARGVETFTTELGERLAKHHAVDFFHAEKDFHVIQPSSSVSFAKRFFLDSASLSVLKFTLHIFPLLWRQNYDVLIPANGFWQVLLCKFIALFKRSKVLITGHSGKGWDERWNLLLSPTCFVATSQEIEAWAKSVAPWVNIVLIPLAIDIEKFKSARPAKLPLTQPVILCPAAADPYKRVDLTIKAVSKLKNVSLFHLGGGTDLATVNTLGQELLGPERFASQQVSYSEIPGIFKAVQLVTLASTAQESFGIVLLEALASGKLVVASDTPKNRWILGPGGIFVDPENLTAYSEALASGLEKIPDHKAIETHLEKFSWPVVEKAYETLLSNL